MNRFHEKAHVEFSEDGKRIMLLDPLWRLTTDYGPVEIPYMFWSDGASIPQLFWNILHPFGPYLESAILHDYLYKMGDSMPGNTRKKADMAFLESMESQSVPRCERYIIYSAVRAFGWHAWRQHKKERNKV